MTTLLLQLVAWVAVALMRQVLTRYQWMEEGQQTEFKEALARAEKALAWKTTGTNLDLRVRAGAQAPTLQSNTPGATGPAPDGAVLSPGTDELHGGKNG